jgi:hypothetical protein
MQRIIAACFLAGLLTPAIVFSQYGYGRRVRGPIGANPTVSDLPAATFQGNLRAITKKELQIDVVDTEQQSLTFRVSKKTKFLKDGKEIKLKDVTTGTLVAVDATRDPDQKFSALNVVLNPPKPKSAEQQVSARESIESRP